ncbi:MAG: LCP family protein [Clostridia bacterium]|nr:LCP family protein [Clostridia bacterium]
MKTKYLIPRLAALLLALCLLPVLAPAEEPDQTEQSDWENFLLVCNEGMNNDKGNAGNTLMVCAMNTKTGRIRLVSFTWDTFIDYEGYDIPQRLDMPYRNNGPEEAMKVFNENFGLGLTRYLSLNYLNLASLIDDYSGVTVDITRAERNALNGMVASKKNQLQNMVATGTLTQAALDSLATDYILEDFGPDTHLNGLQAVGFGWLQYDSVYNCCGRELQVIANLFESVGNLANERAVFYTDETENPGEADGRRAINLDHVTDEDREFIRALLAPIFEKSAHNLSEEDIESISMALIRATFQAFRQGVNVLHDLDTAILPLEAQDPYEYVGGTAGHVVDKEANKAAIREFLYGD